MSDLGRRTPVRVVSLASRRINFSARFCRLQRIHRYLKDYRCDLWSHGQISVSQEHKFTTFYNAVISKMENDSVALADPVPIEILLCNVPGNAHLLGIKVLSLWLKSKGISTAVVPARATYEQILAQIEYTKPRFFGISVTLVEQVRTAMELKDLVQRKLLSSCPDIVLGGNALKGKTGTYLNEHTTFIPSADELLRFLKERQTVP